jgi:uncharacterized protein
MGINNTNKFESQTTLPYDPAEVHIFEVEEKKLAFIASTLEIYELDNMAFDLFTLPYSIVKNKYDADAIAELRTTLLKLGILGTSKENKIDYSSQTKDSHQNITQLMLVVSQECNMKCIYCLANKGAFFEKHTLMPTDVGQKSVDFLLQHSGDSRVCSIIFTGGEPLLNFPTIKATVQYAEKVAYKHKKKIIFLLSTNGTIMNKEILQFIKDHLIYLNYSLDGPPDIQNRLRPFANGQDSYNTVVKNLKMLVDNGYSNNVLIRTTITRYNMDMIKVAEHLFSLGIRKIAFGKSAPNTFCDYHIYGIAHGTLEEEEYVKNYLSFTKYMIKKFVDDPSRSITNMGNIIDLHLRWKKPLGCGMGQFQVAISPGGEIYPCGVFIGLDAYKIGDLVFGFYDHKFQEKYAQILSDRRVPCKICWARFICGGGCHIGDSLENNKPISESSCNLAKRLKEIDIFGYAFLRDLVGIDYLDKRLEKYLKERTPHLLYQNKTKNERR